MQKNSKSCCQKLLSENEKRANDPCYSKIQEDIGQFLQMNYWFLAAFALSKFRAVPVKLDEERDDKEGMHRNTYLTARPTSSPPSSRIQDRSPGDRLAPTGRRNPPCASRIGRSEGRGLAPRATCQSGCQGRSSCSATPPLARS